MKIYTLNAACKQEMTQKTQVTALADGAQNCWSVILSLAPHCKELVCILDWFHIDKQTKKMQWTHDGVHNVLQIRGLLESNEWVDRWQPLVLEALMDPD
ncbi:MAG: hypothetical protein HC790_10995 [Acaryochloridaceae cyanobacterium CSU_3_4]|nr:hypothetical protein [Acaryochloridaceae cyanobacterium CSU_3_4]